MDVIHRILAYGIVAAVAGGVAWSALLTRRGQTGTPGFEQYQAAVVALVIVTAASGLGLLVSGSRPAEGLHLLYGLVAVALIPLARSFVGRTGGRTAGVLHVIAFLVLAAVVYRLFTTG